MKKAAFALPFLLSLVLMFPAVAQKAGNITLPANRGRVLESLPLKSKILKSEMKYSVYLPPDYDATNRRYPVVYLLHGYTDDETGWLQFGQANAIADKGILAGEVPPMIIVMPDAGVTWYMNDYQNTYRYEDYFVQELIPYIDATYRTRTKREYRGVAGLSMGGQGAVLLAMRHPDLFVACAGLSSAFWTDEEIVSMDAKPYNNYFGKLFGENLTGQARISENFRKYSPLHLARTLPHDQLTRTRWYLDCGDDDFLYKGNAAMHVLLSDLKIPHEYRVRDGAHNWSYWRTGLPVALKFIGESFHR
jgi:S-formylglutathione hydrolase FrmB